MKFHARIVATKFHFKKAMKKKGSEILIIVLLLLLISIVIDISWNIRVANTGIENLEFTERVWLIPNDASCGDIWNAEELEKFSKRYELKPIEKE